jgi:hypothetical protein
MIGLKCVAKSTNFECVSVCACSFSNPPTHLHTAGLGPIEGIPLSLEAVEWTNSGDEDCVGLLTKKRRIDDEIRKSKAARARAAAFARGVQECMRRDHEALAKREEAAAERAHAARPYRSSDTAQYELEQAQKLEAREAERARLERKYAKRNGLIRAKTWPLFERKAWCTQHSTVDHPDLYKDPRWYRRSYRPFSAETIFLEAEAAGRAAAEEAAVEEAAAVVVREAAVELPREDIVVEEPVAAAEESSEVEREDVMEELVAVVVLKAKTAAAAVRKVRRSPRLLELAAGMEKKRVGVRRGERVRVQTLKYQG